MSRVFSKKAVEALERKGLPGAEPPRESAAPPPANDEIRGMAREIYFKLRPEDKAHAEVCKGCEDSIDILHQLLTQVAARARLATLEEAATFIETHGVITSKWDVQGNPVDYKIYERNKHPFDPLAHAIRGLRGAELQKAVTGHDRT